MQGSDYAATGIAGVDKLLEDKGIPRGHVVFVVGSPGSGKTTLALQFLYNGISQFGEAGVYISFDEELAHLKRHALRFGWDLARLEAENHLRLFDASPLRRVDAEVKTGKLTLGREEFTMRSLVEGILRNAADIHAARIVIDPVAMLILQYPDEPKRRNAIRDLMQGVVSTGATTLLVSELAASAVERTYQFEEYLAHGVFMLVKVLRPTGALRVFSVEKMRGVNHDPHPHPYRITAKGIEVFPSEIAL